MIKFKYGEKKIGVGNGGVYRGNKLASHPAAPSSILGDPKNSSLAVVSNDGTA